MDKSRLKLSSLCGPSDIMFFNYPQMARKDIDNTPMRLALIPGPFAFHNKLKSGKLCINFLYVCPFLAPQTTLQAYVLWVDFAGLNIFFVPILIVCS